MSRHFTEEQHHYPHEFIGDMLLGLNDGVANTLVFALSLAGASRTNHTVVLAVLAEMLAGGVAMFLGGFISTQSQKEAIRYQAAVERREIEQEPEEEREELRGIYRDKGFSETQVGEIVDHLTSDSERWLQALVRDELLPRPGEFPIQLADVKYLPLLEGVRLVDNRATRGAGYRVARMLRTPRRTSIRRPGWSGLIS
jgi:VIT family